MLATMSILAPQRDVGGHKMLILWILKIKDQMMAHISPFQHFNSKVERMEDGTIRSASSIS